MFHESIASPVVTAPPPQGEEASPEKEAGKEVETPDKEEPSKKESRRTYLAEIKEGRNENIFAIIKSYTEPAVCKGRDYVMKLNLADESLQPGESISLLLFFDSPDLFPRCIQEMRSVIKAPKAAYNFQKSRTSLLLDRKGGFHIFLADKMGLSYYPCETYKRRPYVEEPGDRGTLCRLVEHFLPDIPAGLLPLSLVTPNLVFTAIGTVEDVHVHKQYANISLADATSTRLSLTVWERPESQLPKKKQVVRIDNIRAREIRGLQVLAQISACKSFSWRSVDDTPEAKMLRMFRASTKRVLCRLLVDRVQGMDLCAIRQAATPATLASVLQGPGAVLQMSWGEPMLEDILRLPKMEAYYGEKENLIATDKPMFQHHMEKKGAYIRKHVAYHGSTPVVFLEANCGSSMYMFGKKTYYFVFVSSAQQKTGYLFMPQRSLEGEDSFY